MVTLDRNTFKNVKLFVGMPCYGGKMCAMTTRCMLQLQQMSIMLNFPIQFDFILSESLIPRARNRIVYNFLKSDFTHLMFIDADIECVTTHGLCVTTPRQRSPRVTTCHHMSPPPRSLDHVRHIEHFRHEGISRQNDSGRHLSKKILGE